MAENLYSEFRKKFQNTLLKRVLPRVSCYEEERKKRLVFSKLIFIVPLILIALYTFTEDCFYRIQSDSNFCEVYFKTVSLVFLVISFWMYKIQKYYEYKLKSYIMPLICQCFEKLEWISGKKYTNPDSNEYTDSNLIKGYTSYSYDDVFKGAHNGVNYTIEEICFRRNQGKSTVVVFGGAVIKFDMNKRFKGNTVIKPDSHLHIPPSPNLRHTTLEDVVFEKKFDVYTDDEVEARYLITTAFMERLLNVKTAFQANGISCAFYKDKMYLALSTPKDLFTLFSLNKPVNNIEQFNIMYEEILSIIKLVDHFKLEQKIGL